MAEAVSEYHAHIYYDSASRATAEALRARIAERFPAARLGRWHDTPVGPHPRAMYQVAFAPVLLAGVFAFLLLERAGLTILLHAETGDDLTDHTAHACWMGEMLPLRLAAFSPAPRP